MWIISEYCSFRPFQKWKCRIYQACEKEINEILLSFWGYCWEKVTFCVYIFVKNFEVWSLSIEVSLCPCDRAIYLKAGRSRPIYGLSRGSSNVFSEKTYYFFAHFWQRHLPLSLIFGAFNVNNTYEATKSFDQSFLFMIYLKS